MRAILSTVAALTAAAIGASAAAAADPVVPFPSQTGRLVFVAAQTVTTGGAMTNYFAPGSTVVIRAYAVNTKTKKLITAKDKKFFYATIPNQSNVKLAYNPSAPGATKGMPWVGTWTIPSDYAPGTVPIDVKVKLRSRATGHFIQMPVTSAMLTVSATPPAVFAPAPTGTVGAQTSTKGTVDPALYVDTVNGTRPVGAAPRQVGCSQTNVYKHGEQVVFRVWGMSLADNTVLSSDNVADAHVQIPGVASNLPLNWGGHGAAGAKVWFWSAPWIVPADFPLGEVAAHVVFKLESGATGTFDYALNVIP